MKANHIKLAIAGLVLLFSSSVNAGVYTNDLSRCLVESSTAADKMDLVKWMFTAMALQPAVKSMSNVTAQQRDKSNKDIADLFVKLLTETCKEPAAKAIKYEGQPALNTSFSILGQVAAKELFANPNVAAGLSGLDKHLDKEKLNKALGINNNKTGQ